MSIGPRRGSIALWLILSGLSPAAAQTDRLPGNSIADAVLQHDTMAYVAVNVGIRQKGCPRFKVVDTRFVAYDAAGPRRPWHETWTITACGSTWEVPVSYRPDATGTNITVPVAGPGSRLRP